MGTHVLPAKNEIRPENMPIDYQNDTPGLTDTPGFEAAGVACDVRGNGKETLDLGLVYSPRPCAGAGVFTRNDIVAAPVTLCRSLLSPSGKFHGIVANSGNANACTGKNGEQDALEMAQLAQKSTGSPDKSFFVASTGRIGRPLPMDKISRGIHQAATSTTGDSSGGQAFARAILTSDTRTKTVTAKIRHKEKTYTVAGVAKGAGMIEPNMATMLAFLTTDFKVPTATLQATLLRAVQSSFNCITVDGDMSTNDTVLFLANGYSQVMPDENADLLDAFHEATKEVCQRLARMIVGDGERVEHLVTLKISRAPSVEAAEKIARCIGNSLLVKTSWYGSDPNWGRIVDAAGYARIGLKLEDIDLFYNDTPVLQKGVPVEGEINHWKEIVSQREFSIHLSLGMGKDAYSLLTTDLTEGYVDYNKSE